MVTTRSFLKNTTRTSYLLLFILIFFNGCMEPSVPQKGGQFEEYYKGAKVSEIKSSKYVTSCNKTEVIFLPQEEDIRYNDILENEFKLGNIELGSSMFNSKKYASAQNELKIFAQKLGSCKVYWTILKEENTKIDSYQYAALYFIEANKDLMVGILPERPSVQTMKDMGRFYGVYVKAIMSDSMAQKIGIKEEDVILFINDNRCTYENYLSSYCDTKEAWKVIRLFRDGKIIELK